MNPIHPMQTGTGQKQNKRQIKKKTNPMKKSKLVDYLDPKFLSRFTNDQGKILPRRITGVNAFQQREISKWSQTIGGKGEIPWHGVQPVDRAGERQCE